MSWTESLRMDIEDVYRATEHLLGFVDEESLDWKPGTGNNWMSMGQLMLHLATVCGPGFRGFVTGDWGLPKGVTAEEKASEDIATQAVEFDSISGVKETRKLLTADKELALRMVQEASEQNLASRMVRAPWAPVDMLLGYALLQMTGHLKYSNVFETPALLNAA